MRSIVSSGIVGFTSSGTEKVTVFVFVSTSVVGISPNFLYVSIFSVPVLLLPLVMALAHSSGNSYAVITALFVEKYPLS